jgi:murein DD-endopeptidase MepM/ murein hydrolase activator NlpD
MVSFAGQVGGSLFVSIDHAGGLRTTYSFLSAILVKKGQAVVQGQPIALSGPGAAGEKPNLHFGLRSGSEYLDPEPYLLASIRRNLWRVIRLAPIP